LKKAVSILLIFSVVSPFWLFISILKYEKLCLKKEIKRNIIAGINKSELALLKFSREEINIKLRWEHPKEFEYNNEMYDIVESEIRNDSVYYWCWRDYEETQLNKKLDILVKHASGMNKKNTEQANQIMNFFSSFYNNNFADNYNLKPPVSKAVFPIWLLNYSSRNTIPDTPPPRS